jgi:hypothetical protein
MTWTERMSEGFAVAALAHDDPDGTRAARGLAPHAQSPATRVLAELGAHERSATRTFLRQALATAPVDPAFAPRGTHAAVRARALLAAHVERTLGREWLQAAPAVRSGFTSDARLVRWLLRRAGGAR